ncbi:TAF1B [Bugula neritina]|uniref:TAF1B n=1 Tax=Bugula neritina TaxID=10212 RepID=A0A7J7KSC6_BUGNE|nr:TAF1B [Bugula neritina]
MIKCLVCEGTSFYNANGLYFCKICDTQTIEFHEEEDLQVQGQSEEGVPGNQIVGARITQPSQSHQLNDCVTEENNITVLQQAKDVVKEKCDAGRPFTTFEVFQLILSSQTNELLKYGFPAILRQRVFKIWCIYLSELGEAFTSKKNYKLDMPHVRERDASRLTKESTPAFCKRKLVQDYEEVKDNHTSQFKVPLTQGTGENYNTKYAPNRLNMNTLLCILYLGISLTSPIYTISDIIRWIKEGRLSYFNADKALPKDIKFVRKDHNMFSHLVLPTHYTLRILTANMARYLKFGNEDFPAMNIEKLCIKYMILLNLPGELVGLAINLIRSKRPHLRFTPFNPELRMIGVPMYEAVALSYIIIVLRDLFGFHNRLHQHLSEYADKLQKDLPTDARPLFNVEKWMQYQLSSRDKLMDLPQSNLDTQRLSSLNLSLKSYTAIAPPASRFASTKGILSQQINRETTRRQLQTVTERLASEVNAIKVQKQAADIQQEENVNDDDGTSVVSTHLSTNTSWSQPGATSTQRQYETSVRSEEKLDEVPEATDFRPHTLQYLLHHKNFCEKHCLFTEKYKYKTVKEHVEMYTGSDHSRRVTRALMSSGNYKEVSKEEFDQSPELSTLFLICADYFFLTIKELKDVYYAIEEAYICSQNHINPGPFSLQYMYFPRPLKSSQKGKSKAVIDDADVKSSSDSDNEQKLC